MGENPKVETRILHHLIFFFLKLLRLSIYKNLF